MKNKSIAIGSDHGGYELKSVLIEYLNSIGYQTLDVGTDSLNSVDYPVIAKKLTDKIVSGEVEQGILICGTGVGMGICANKVKGIRAVICSEITSAKYSKLHNNANVLCIGARVIGEEVAKDICKTWLETEFTNEERHLRRINLIEKF